MNRALPFLRWAGSKRQILAALEPYWNSSYARYVEPFVGSACLFFRISPKKALLGDINEDLIRTYVEVKVNARAILEELKRFKNTRERYLSARGLDPSIMSASERAARFIYLNRFCFNGLYRTNLKGQFNVPYGGLGSGNLPEPEELLSCGRALENAELVCGDFEKVLRKTKKGDFVYMDPPFSVQARRVFNEYNPAVFSEKDVRRLRQWMEKLANDDIDFLVSYAESDEAEYLGKGFDFSSVSVRRNIAGFTERRNRASEYLIANKGFSCSQKRNRNYRY